MEQLMIDERTKAADELKRWRVRHKESLAGNERGTALQLEQSLRVDAVPEGAVDAVPENYPDDAD